MIAKPSIEVREYLKASGSIAIYAIIRRNRTVVFGAAADPWEAAARDLELLDLFWTRAGVDRGAITVGRVLQVFSETAGAGEAERAHTAMAQVMGEARGAPHAGVIEIAECAVAIVDRQLRAAAASGGLKHLHREYRAARAAGIEKRPWGTYRREYRLRMVSEVAQAADSRTNKYR